MFFYISRLEHRDLLHINIAHTLILLLVSSPQCSFSQCCLILAGYYVIIAFELQRERQYHVITSEYTEHLGVIDVVL